MILLNNETRGSNSRRPAIMKYKLTKKEEVKKKEKVGISLDVYPDVSDCGLVIITTEKGHNSEFVNKRSTFTYIVIDGEGLFFLDDEEVSVAKGDSISIEPNTRIYYKGKLKLVLITTPAWRQEDETIIRTFNW